MKTFELQIQVWVRSNQGDSLSVSETVIVQAKDFLSIAGILGKFHDLAESLRERKVDNAT